MADTILKSVEELKSKGNDAFAKNDFTLADKFYTEAIKLLDIENYSDNESDANYTDEIKNILSILYSNRAACKLGLNDYATSLEDANKAIHFNKSYVKAYYRKVSFISFI